MQDTTSIYRNQLHFFTCTEYVETKIKNLIPFIITPNKKEKHLYVNLTKYIQDLYGNDYKTLKKSKKIQIYEETYCTHRRLNIVNIQISPNWYTSSTQFLSKFQQLFIDIHKVILKFICKGKGTRTAETFFWERGKREEITVCF